MDEQENKNQVPANAAPQDELEKLKKERDEYLSGWQRAKADFINYKKDELKRLEEIARYGNEDLMRELITVLDNFDLAISVMESQKVTAPTPEGGRSPDQHVGIEKGVYMIRTQIEDILRRRGLERISVKPGEKFDPSVAEAIAEVESDQPEGTIIEEIEPGWRLYDKIVRPARVKVSKNKN